MKRFRLAVFFVFYALAELAVPQAPAALEAAAEEAEDIFHLTRRMGLSRSALEPRAPVVACSATVDVASRLTTVPIEPRGPAAPIVVCKIPPPAAESPSASEDH